MTVRPTHARLKPACFILLGALGFTPLALRTLHAEAPAPAYIVNEIQVTDPGGFATYASREGALIARFGGRFLVRGGAMDGISGGLPERVAIYVFDNLAQAKAWRDAPEQKELVTIRDKASHFRSFIVEGCASCAAPKS